MQMQYKVIAANLNANLVLARIEMKLGSIAKQKVDSYETFLSHAFDYQSPVTMGRNLLDTLRRP